MPTDEDLRLTIPSAARLLKKRARASTTCSAAWRRDKFRVSMKVLAINGSARKDGNTAILIRYVFSELEAAGIECEMVQLAGKKIHGCVACRTCFARKDGYCAQKDDEGNALLDMMKAADGIILGSPTYVADVTPEIKALIDRACMVARATDSIFRRKVGAAVVAVRRAGAIHAFDALNHFFLITEMIIAGSSYWNIGVGRERGDVENDAEGIQTMRTLGQNMAWVMERTAG